MKITIEGHLNIPDDTLSVEQISWANSCLRIDAHEYSERNLHMLTGIHWMKIYKWKQGFIDLMLSELIKLANLLEIKMNIDGISR